ncbi:hypothetical protein SLS62_005180 [Diatrype stigma]|uniref:Exonuclease domain-containing protein n=1 Tax=Diatrype stigma TaxID=117547 RepID=A0AAN9YNP1_9PEZI
MDRITYPAIDAFPIATFSYGQNQYSVFSPDHQQILYEALKLRCHAEKELTDRRYVTSTELFTQSEGIRVPNGVDRADLVATPSASRARQAKRKVVALDCEMVGVRFGTGDGKTCEVSELAQLCAIDVLTGEVLIDVLVQPPQKVSNWRTRYSGLNPAAMRSARNAGRMLWGWHSARAALLKHIDAGTVLVGHDLQSDLFMLRLAHGLVVDTAIQTAEAVFGRRPLRQQQRQEEGEGSNKKTCYNNRIWGLKVLCKDLLGMNIQVGRKGHDCVEDTLATRELALWCLCNQAKLAAWAQDMRELLERQRIERERKQEEEKKKKREEEKKKHEEEEKKRQQQQEQDGSREGARESAQGGACLVI